MLDIEMPFDELAERAILGGLITEPSLFKLAREYELSAKDFYLENHRALYLLLEELFLEKGSDWDDIVLFEKAQKKGIELQKAFVYALVEEASLGTLFEEALRRVKELSLLRQAKDMALKLLQAKSVEEIKQSTTHLEELFKLQTSSLKPAHELISELYDKLQQARKREKLISGIESGYMELDRLIDGFHKGHLIIIGARPGMGKSSFMLCLAHNFASKGHKVLIISLEMSSQELGERWLSMASSVPLANIRSGMLTEEDMQVITSHAIKLRTYPLWIQDAGMLTPMDIKLLVREIKPDIVFVDYLQLIRYEKPYATRQEEVAYISRFLKALAKDLNVCVVALAQLSRQVEQRSDKRPNLADLRESGQIEQDADLVMFLYRPDYYKKDGKKEGKAELIIAKNRHGPTGIVGLYFDSKTTGFSMDFVSQKEEEEEEYPLLDF